VSVRSAGSNADDGPVFIGDLAIDPRFNGPIGWANGGYACGLIAGAIDPDRSVHTSVEVTLRRPVPLATPLRLVRTANGGHQLSFDDQLIADVGSTPQAPPPPPVRPDLLTAGRARLDHPGWPADGPLADCFVCSARRRDGLHVTAGPLPGHPGAAATPFEPASCRTRIDAAGVVAPEFIWAALDCPSVPVSALLAGRVCLLGTFAAVLHREIRIEESLVVVGWVREHERRVYRTASAMIDAAGNVVAGARATWIELKG